MEQRETNNFSNVTSTSSISVVPPVPLHILLNSLSSYGSDIYLVCKSGFPYEPTNPRIQNASCIIFSYALDMFFSFSMSGFFLLFFFSSPFLVLWSCVTSSSVRDVPWKKNPPPSPSPHPHPHPHPQPHMPDDMIRSLAFLEPFVIAHNKRLSFGVCSLISKINAEKRRIPAG